MFRVAISLHSLLLMEWGVILPMKASGDVCPVSFYLTDIARLYG